MWTRQVEHSPADGFLFCVPEFRVVLGKSSILGRLSAYNEIFAERQENLSSEVNKAGMYNQKILPVNTGIFNHFSDSVLAIVEVNSSWQNDTRYIDQTRFYILM